MVDGGSVQPRMKLSPRPYSSSADRQLPAHAEPLIAFLSLSVDRNRKFKPTFLNLAIIASEERVKARKRLPWALTCQSRVGSRGRQFFLEAVIRRAGLHVRHWSTPDEPFSRTHGTSCDNRWSLGNVCEQYRAIA
jgi:hypothetical protein